MLPYKISGMPPFRHINPVNFLTRKFIKHVSESREKTACEIKKSIGQIHEKFISIVLTLSNEEEYF